MTQYNTLNQNYLTGNLTLFRMGRPKILPSPSPNSYFSVTYTNARISPKNFLIFNFKRFDRLV